VIGEELLEEKDKQINETDNKMAGKAQYEANKVPLISDQSRA